jgi:four helix bundle protein
MITSFKDLKVYQIAYEESLVIHRLSVSWPSIDQYGLGNQIRQASKSICANLAEGFGKQKFSKAEYKRYIQIAVGSSDEVKVWLDYAKDLGYIETESYERLYGRYQEISKMLVTLHIRWDT